MPKYVGNNSMSSLRGTGVVYGAEVRSVFTGQPPRGDAEA